jgi:hypothetical protein
MALIVIYGIEKRARVFRCVSCVCVCVCQCEDSMGLLPLNVRDNMYAGNLVLLSAGKSYERTDDGFLFEKNVHCLLLYLQGHTWRHFFTPWRNSPLLGQSLLVVETSRSHSDTPHSVGLLWTSYQHVAETST